MPQTSFKTFLDARVEAPIRSRGKRVMSAQANGTQQPGMATNRRRKASDNFAENVCSQSVAKGFH